MDVKAFNGILNAAPEKRYKNFISTAADTEEVWLLENSDGYATCDLDGVMYLLVWPSSQFAELFADEDTPVCVEVHDFLEGCRDFLESPDVQFMVFPNDTDTYIVHAEKMIEDLTAELSRVE